MDQNSFVQLQTHKVEVIHFVLIFQAIYFVFTFEAIYFVLRFPKVHIPRKIAIMHRQ